MRVTNFENLDRVKFLKEILTGLGLAEDQIKAVLSHIQTGAATITSGRVSSPDQDLVRAVKALRHDILNSGGGLFEGAVSALADTVNWMSVEELLEARMDTIVKAAAKQSGLHIDEVGALIESLKQDEEGEDTPLQRVGEANAWGLRRDPEYRHGEMLPVSHSMLIDLRDNLAQARGIGVNSVGKLMLSLGNAAVAAAREKKGVCEGGRRSQLTLASMPVDVAGLVEDSTWRLDIVDVPAAWERLDDEQTTILALALPLAESLEDAEDLLAMSREDQYLAVHALGNLCKTWLERARKCLEVGEVPTLAEAIGKKAVKRGVRRAAARRAVEPVVVSVTTTVAVVDTTSLVQANLDLFSEVPAEAVVPAEKPVCRRTRKPAGRCAIAARRVRSRRRCLLTVDLFEGGLAAAPGCGGKEGVEPAHEVANAVIDAVRRGATVQGLALGVPEPVERGGGLEIVEAEVDDEGVVL